MDQYREYQGDFNRRHQSTNVGEAFQTAMMKIQIIFFVVLVTAFAFGFYLGTKKTAQKCATEVAESK